MHSTFSRLIRPFSLSIAAALALSACGGGGSDTPTAVVGAQTGVFVDSAVEGLSYETSSGVKGTTDAQGHFKYNEGDTVTFKVGGVTIGSGKATGTLSPAGISGGEDNNKFTNLLVLLQSLDTDGDPSNGITLPAGLDGTKLAKVAERLNDDPADFTDDSKNAELKQASPKGAIRSREDARKHYEDTQAKTSDFLDGAAGVWVGQDSSDRSYTLRLTPSGRYMLSVQSDDAEQGTEVGSFTRDATTGLITTSDIKTDTNGDGGWSKLGANRTVALAFTSSPEDHNYTASLSVTLTVAGEPVVATLHHPEQRSGDLVGAWSTSPDLRINAPLVLLEPGKGYTYTYIAPESTSATCGAGAIEYGSFQYRFPIDISSLSAVPVLAPSAPSAPSTPPVTFGESMASEGCNFFGQYSGSAKPTVLSEDKMTLTVLNPEDNSVLFKLYRIKRDKEWFQEDWNNWAD
jgi:hypothetical protein